MDVSCYVLRILRSGVCPFLTSAPHNVDFRFSINVVVRKAASGVKQEEHTTLATEWLFVFELTMLEECMVTAGVKLFSTKCLLR